jgi:hypothetical protein
VPPRDDVDANLRFSLIRRPSPYDRAPPMLLVTGGITSSQWDDVMSHLARWLVRHLTNQSVSKATFCLYDILLVRVESV